MLFEVAQERNREGRWDDYSKMRAAVHIHACSQLITCKDYKTALYMYQYFEGTIKGKWKYRI